MSKLTKNQKAAVAKFDHTKAYSLSEACAIVKDVTYTKFDATVELSANLGVDPRKANQMIRGVVTLPHGTGKVVRVLALCTPDKEAEAKAAGAKVGALGKILGPRGLMPNPKTGTVTMEIGNAVKEVKGGKIDFKVDKTGIIHTGIGKVSFTAQQLYENAAEVLNAISKLKPQALKGTYMKSAAICSTMSPGIKVDLKAFLNGAE